MKYLLVAAALCALAGAADAAPTSVRVSFDRQAGVTGTQRVNFAVPLAPGVLSSVADTKVTRTDGVELAAARRSLATWPDGSVRSVQIQVNAPASLTAVDVHLGVAGTVAPLARIDVWKTLMTSSGTTGPKVWAYLPPAWIGQSELAGPLAPAAADDPWEQICRYDDFGVDAFLAVQSARGSWLYDRPTALYRGYGYAGDPGAFRSAYREAAIYRAGITGTGTATRIGIPGAANDLKYHYAQGLALHYLLTGDPRFREAAENVAIRAHQLWLDPGYEGAADFWTERHAGFALLAYEWAAAVSDDQAKSFRGWSDVAVTAYAAMQDASQYAWESDARCFAHHADAHGEGYGYVGCSPWMSAILAEGLDAYARRVTGPERAVAKTAIVELGRMIARYGRDHGGKPFYWMGAGTDEAEIDDHDEHWGESAYVVALAWWHQGQTDVELRAAADELVAGVAEEGYVGQLRSFNWQCRAAVMTPALLD